MERIGLLSVRLPAAPRWWYPGPCHHYARSACWSWTICEENLCRDWQNAFREGADLGPAGKALLAALTDAFGRCIFSTGFFHADPHPGNLFVLDDGRIGLIDFGQVKQISGKARCTLGKVMCALARRERSTEEPYGVLRDLEPLAELGDELGVVLRDGALRPEGPAAVSMWLFDDASEPLPGGFEQSELFPRKRRPCL